MECNNITVQWTALAPIVKGLIHWFSKFNVFSDLQSTTGPLILWANDGAGKHILIKRDLRTRTHSFSNGVRTSQQLRKCIFLLFMLCFYDYFKMFLTFHWSSSLGFSQRSRPSLTFSHNIRPSSWKSPQPEIVSNLRSQQQPRSWKKALAGLLSPLPR